MKLSTEVESPVISLAEGTSRKFSDAVTIALSEDSSKVGLLAAGVPSLGLSTALGVNKTHFTEIGFAVSYSKFSVTSSSVDCGFLPLHRACRFRVPSGAKFFIASASIEHVGQLLTLLRSTRSLNVTSISGVLRLGKFLQTEHKAVASKMSADLSMPRSALS